MSFGKFLAAGKSIINSRGSVAYREKKGVFLPKFESPKNPFAKAPASGPAAEPGAAPETRPAKISPAPAPAVRPASRSHPAVARSSTWVASLNPLAMFRPAHGPSSRPLKAEQTELSLDTVRVVGNDLCDADVEVVPLKSRPARVKSATPPDEEWSEVGHGVMGANLV